MDVHAPDHPIHTKRDFFIHLFTITVGLLIALSLEGLVEYFHHRHIVHEARVNIRQEIENNHEGVQNNLLSIQKALDDQTANLTTLRDVRDHPGTARIDHLSFAMSFNPPDDAAWTTARDTGALNYMPYEQVEAFSGLYRVQDIVNKQVLDLLHEEELGVAPAYIEAGIDKLSPSDVNLLLHNAASLRSELGSLKEILGELDKVYVDELKKS